MINNCHIKKTYPAPASQFAKSSEAPVGEYFPDAATLRMRQDARIKADVLLAIWRGELRRQKAWGKK